MDDRNRSLVERLNTFFGMMGVSLLLNIALIIWSIYKELWWITAIAVVIGLVMLWQAWTIYQRRRTGR